MSQSLRAGLKQTAVAPTEGASESCTGLACYLAVTDPREMCVC